MTGLLPGLGINADRLFHGGVGPTGTSLYTTPGTAGGAARTSISGLVIANPSNSALRVRLGLVPQGATSDGTHYLLGDLAILAHDTEVLALPVVLRAGDVLEGYSDPLPGPAGLYVLSATTGGALAANTYYYKVTATNAGGESLGSFEQFATTTGTTSSVALSWARSLGASGYKIYRGTAASTENVLVATISNGATVAFTDTGAATTSATPPTAGTANGCVFTISGSELSA